MVSHASACRGVAQRPDRARQNPRPYVHRIKAMRESSNQNHYLGNLAQPSCLKCQRTCTNSISSKTSEQIGCWPMPSHFGSFPAGPWCTDYAI
ncbi:unnamed protein product [Rhodiola kirilowii]